MLNRFLSILLLASFLLASCTPSAGNSPAEKSMETIIDISKVTLPQGYIFQSNGNTQLPDGAGVIVVGGGAALLDNPIGWIVAGGAMAWSIYAYNNPAEAGRAAKDLADGAYFVYIFTANSFTTTINDVLAEETFATTDSEGALTDEQESQLRNRKFKQKIRNMVYAVLEANPKCYPDQHNHVYDDLREIMNNRSYEPKSLCPKIILLDIARQIEELLTPQLPYFMGVKALSELSPEQIKAIFQIIIPYQ